MNQDLGKFPSEWQFKTVDEIKSNCKHAIAMGPFGSNIKTENYVSSGVPVIRGTNLNYYKYPDGMFVFVSEQKANELKASLCVPDDLIFTHRGTLGQVGLIPSNKYAKYLVSQSGMKLSVNKKIINPLFAFYFFKSELGQNQLLQYESQVGVPAISNPLTSLKKIILPIPPLAEQRAIATVLSNIDEKIGLLQRQNSTLESMGEALFKQWFVTEANEGWEEGQLYDLFELQRGFDLPVHKRQPGKISIISSSGMTGYHSEYMVNGPGVVIGRSGVLGNVFYIKENFWPLNTTLYIKKYKYSTPIFSYFLLKSFQLNVLNAGSAVPTLNRNHVHILPCKIPPLTIINNFENESKKFFNKIHSNNTQIHTLEKLRDTLLPKLMSGEVRVALD